MKLILLIFILLFYSFLNEDMCLSLDDNNNKDQPQIDNLVKYCKGNKSIGEGSYGKVYKYFDLNQTSHVKACKWMKDSNSHENKR